MTASEVAIVNDAALAALDPASREGAVTAYLSHARDQLALAVEATGPAAIAALKAEIATAAEATKQLGLSKEIQSDAQEMVRRAEYALEKAIRLGKDRGEIKDGRTNTGGTHTAGVVGSVSRSGAERDTRPSPRDYFSNGQERSEAYQMGEADPEEFEAALSEAREEGNLSRANVVRKVKGATSERLTPAEKLAKIQELASTGMTSGQIAAEISASEPYVRNAARQNGIKITADEVLRGTRRVKVDHNHIVSHLVMTLEVVTEGLDRVDLAALDEVQMQNWTDSLTTTTRALNRFVKQMKEAVQ